MDARFQPYDQRKRTRQACVPCRRKKAKCTGERPSCATCARLRQRCFYAADLLPGPVARADTSDAGDAARPAETHPGSGEAEALSARVQSLESTLAQVLASLRQTTPASQPRLPAPRPPSSQSSLDAHDDVAMTLSSPLHTPSRLADADLLPHWSIVLAAGQDYLRYCDSQPIPLFHPDSFIDSLADRDPEVLYGLLALARRFSHGSGSAQQDQQASEKLERECAVYVQAARRITMLRVAEANVELSTIQTLCLLAYVEFYNGAIDQSRVHISLASSLAHCARLHREVNRQEGQPAAEERQRCYWGIVLLQRLLGWPPDEWNDGCSSDNSSSWDRDGQLPLFPASPSAPPSESEAPDAAGTRRDLSTETQRAEGILGTVIQLAEVWSLAQDYVRTRGKNAAATVPWSPQSQYSRALRRLMDLGRELPTLHRNRCIRLANVSAEDLRDSRAYWAPWFLSHFLYHTAICLLNHPLLMTQQFQGGFSEVFLQQTTHLAAYHASWLLHFVDFFNRRQFTVTDPLFGYCVAIVATIELQHSFSNDHALRQKARANYDHCLDFLRKLGGRGGSSSSSPWPCIGRLVQKLDALADQMKTYHSRGSSSNDDDSSIHISDATLIVNVKGFLELLDLAASVRVPGCAPLFGGATLPLHSSTDEAALGPTPLSRLPGITALDPAQATGRGEVGEADASGNARSDSRLALSSPQEQEQPQQQPQDQSQDQPQQLQQPQQPQQRTFSLDGGSDVFLPVDQLFGGHLQDANAWWSGTWGDAAGSWSSGALGRSAWPLDGSEAYSF